MKVTYKVEGNCISLSNGTKEKHLEWIHAGILRVYEKKNSEELVRLNYRKESVESEIATEGDNLLIHTRDYEIRVDEELSEILACLSLIGNTVAGEKEGCVP